MTNHIYSMSYTFIRNVSYYSSVRLYSRWMHRKPAKVILPFEPDSNINLKKEQVIDLASNDLNKKNNVHRDQNKKTENTPLASKEKFKEVKEKKETLLKKRKFYLSQKKVFDDDGSIIYEKLNNNDGRISSLLVRLKSKKERLRSQQILVEGWRLIVDGLEAKCVLKYVIFSQVDDLNKLRPFLPNTGVKFYKIPYNEIELWSDVETSPGIFGVFDTPTPDKINWLSKPMPINFICDNVRTPGNLGGILRAAVGVGCEKVILTKGCVDHWDPKILRSGAGAHFRQPIIPSIDWEELPNHLAENTSLFIADSNTKNIDSESDNSLECNLPVVPYYAVDFAKLNHVTLIIGGETEGISENSYSLITQSSFLKFLKTVINSMATGFRTKIGLIYALRLAANRNGLRLNIPLQKGVDSLNTGMAAAVIAFEIRKQFIQASAKAKLDRQKIKEA